MRTVPFPSSRRRGRPRPFLRILWLLAVSTAGAAIRPAEAEDGAGDRDGGLEEPESEGYETVVRGERTPLTEETTAFAERIDVADETAGARTVSDVLSQAAGVQVRQLGGLGSFGAASIRGSTSSQVPVTLDGIPLNAGGFSTVDLGDLPLASLDAIEVYRGSAPLALGGGGIGGAVALTTRSFTKPFTEAAASTGSWSTGRLVLLRGDQTGSLGVLAAFTAEGSKGDFGFLNRNGTLLDESDDRIERRQNNEHLAFGGLLKLDGALRDFTWRAGNDLYFKQQGIPGIESAPSQTASLRTLRDALRLEIEGPLGRAVTLAVGGSYLALSEDFSDTRDEIGVGFQRTVSQSSTVGLDALTTVGWSERHETSVRLDGRAEEFASQELVADRDLGPIWRARGAVGIGHDWRPVPALLVQPVLRLELSAAEADVEGAYPTFALGARFEVLPGLFLRANGGRYLRLPDVTELFGNSGAVIGNPNLDPEVGYNADAGATYVLERAAALDLLRLDAAWFGSWVADLIAYVQNSQSTIRPENVGAAEILGAEVSLRVDLFHFVGLTGNYTYLHGVNTSDVPYYEGRRLPGRPAHEAFGRVELHERFFDFSGAAWFDGDFAGSSFLDQANLKEVALARLYFGVGLRLSHERTGLTATIEIKNLFDRISALDSTGRPAPLRDFEGFPLPGRTILATVRYAL